VNDPVDVAVRVKDHDAVNASVAHRRFQIAELHSGKPPNIHGVLGEPGTLGHHVDDPGRLRQTSRPYGLQCVPVGRIEVLATEKEGQNRSDPGTDQPKEGCENRLGHVRSVLTRCEPDGRNREADDGEEPDGHHEPSYTVARGHVGRCRFVGHDPPPVVA
jgi:hypothetical protein